MTVYEITEIKKIMNVLLLGEEFDNFRLVEAQVTGAVRYTIDGRVNPEFYTENENPVNADDDFASWKDMKPHILAVIKGKQLPLKFKLVFSLRNADIVRVLSKGGFSEQSEDVTSLGFVISYERDYLDPELIEAINTGSNNICSDSSINGDTLNELKSTGRQRMICTTGFCRKNFTMDKSQENYWDETITGFMEKLENR